MKYICISRPKPLPTVINFGSFTQRNAPDQWSDDLFADHSDQWSDESLSKVDSIDHLSEKGFARKERHRSEILIRIPPKERTLSVMWSCSTSIEIQYTKQPHTAMSVGVILKVTNSRKDALALLPRNRHLKGYVHFPPALRIKFERRISWRFTHNTKAETDTTYDDLKSGVLFTYQDWLIYSLLKLATAAKDFLSSPNHTASGMQWIHISQRNRFRHRFKL